MPPAVAPGLIKDYICSCATCRNEKYTVNSLQILKRCQSEHETKIQEALLIKTLNSTLNKQYGKLEYFRSYQIFWKVMISQKNVNSYLDLT